MICILQSIRHNWNDKIFALIKSIEVRKNAPKCDLPVKVYIYEPIGKGDGCGKVVGEYTLWSIVTDKTCGHDALFNAGACLTEEEAVKYSGGKYLKGWVIEDIVKYDNPKELYEFYKRGAEDIEALVDYETLCSYCAAYDFGRSKSWSSPISGCGFCECSACEDAYEEYLDENFALRRPPQSWCYIKEWKGDMFDD